METQAYEQPTGAPAWLAVVRVPDSDPKVLMTSHLSPRFLSQLAEDKMPGGRAQPLVPVLAGQKYTSETH